MDLKAFFAIASSKFVLPVSITLLNSNILFLKIFIIVVSELKSITAKASLLRFFCLGS